MKLAEHHRALLLAILLAAGCGSESAPTPDLTSLREGGGKEAGVKDGAGAREGGAVEAATAREAATGKTLAVVYGGKSTPVEPSKAPPVPLDGTSYARLSDLVQLALPGKALDGLLVDFEAADGFRPEQSSNCIGLVPIPGAKLAKGYVHPVSFRARWDDDLQYPACMSVKDLAKILLKDK